MHHREPIREVPDSAAVGVRGETRRVVSRLSGRLAARLSPEQTRQPTLLERLTVARLSWDQCVRLNRFLELVGKICTGVWIAFICSIPLGIDWKSAAEHAVNSGKPVKGALALALIVPTLLFLVARSAIGFGRWRLQRELWRRDVARLERGDEPW